MASLWSRAYVLLTFTALFWAGNAIVARAVRELVPPVALAFWRWTIALAIILPFWGLDLELRGLDSSCHLEHPRHWEGLAYWN